MEYWFSPRLDVHIVTRYANIVTSFRAEEKNERYHERGSKQGWLLIYYKSLAVRVSSVIVTEVGKMHRVLSRDPRSAVVQG